jgi:two-component system chemotaxis response regulator CheB
MPGPAKIRVVLVDDSSTVRAVMRRLFSRTDDIEIVDEAADGAQAVQSVLAARPDVVLMDVEMPVLDGYAATERIMAVCPTPILIFTSRANRDQLHTAFEAVARGALDVLAKPEDTVGWERLGVSLPAAVRSLAGERSAGRRQQAAPGSSPESRPAAGVGPRAAVAGRGRFQTVRYVAVGASTGGPAALRDLLAALPSPLPVPILVVQHIAAGFEEGLAEWLAGDLHRDVQVARDGEIARPGTIRLAPSGSHLRLRASGVIQLDAASPPRNGHRPSADELFLSCAAAFPTTTAGVLLTGMGSDGAAGLAVLRQAGGLTMVQDEATSAVFGMPRAALEIGAAELALPPRELGQTLAACWSREQA